MSFPQNQNLEKRDRALRLHSSALLDGAALLFVSVSMTAVLFWAVLCSQLVAQRPAFEGVMTFHLTRQGDLRLWNQPIRSKDLPVLLRRASSLTKGTSPLVIRLIPESQVPWGTIHRMMSRLQPVPPDRNWVLQLQLP